MEQITNNILNPGSVDSKVSERYQYVPTQAAIDVFEAHGFKVRDIVRQGKGPHAKHSVRLWQPQFGSLLANEDVRPEIIILNSYDRTVSFQLHYGLLRMVCTNGLVVLEDKAPPVKIRHLKSLKPVIDNAIEQFAAQHSDVSELIQKTQQIIFRRDMQNALLNIATEARWGKNLPDGIDTQQLLIARRQEDIGSDAWHVFNRIQENVINGTPKYRGATKIRPLKDIRKIHKINTALWQEMVKLAA